MMTANMADPVAMRNYLALKKKSYAVKFNLENTDYTAIENIGTGAYGVVCSAINNKTKQKVAIKKIPGIFGQPVIAKRTYREIKILKHFKHDNIIAIRDILHPGENLSEFKDVYIVLDLMESDLHRIIHSKQEITEEHVRFFTYQILRGLKYIHSANVVHRDLKPSNLLVNENCDLKIGDFGMARGISSNMDDYSMVMTQYVATRWYRAPELILLPKETYNEAVDMWSVGCILAEMLGRKQLFPGKSHMDQIERIIEKLGTPSEEYLKMASTNLITDVILMNGHVKGVNWSDVYPKASKKAVDLLSKMLILEPGKRITANQALKHPFLNKYHDPDDEPVCIPVFNFDFERKNMSTEELKSALLTEIMSYHKAKSCVQFNLQPVPKSVLNQSSLHHTESKSGKDHDLSQNDKKPPDGDLSQESISSSKSDGSFERRHSELIQQLKDLQDLQQSSLATNSQVSDDVVFKKPEGFPLSVKAKESMTCSAAEPKVSSNDVEMYSAKLSSKAGSTDTLNISMKSGEISDIEMKSADHTGNKGNSESSTQQAVSEEKRLDMKERIRRKLAENEQRKQREADNPVRAKPMTAIQKQREREEKRRQKLEKAKQKKKKEKKDKTSSIELTEEDRKLLEKWQNMQKVAAHNGKTTAVEKTDPIIMHNTDSVTQSVASVFIQPPDTSLENSLTKPAELVQCAPSVNIQGQANINCSIPVQVLPVSQGNPISLLISQSNIRTLASTQSNGKIGTSTVSSCDLTDGPSNMAVFSDVTGTQPVMSVPFGSYTQWSGTGNSSAAHIRLPSYMEALQARTNQTEDWLQKSNPVHPLNNISMPLIDNTKPGSNQQWPTSERDGAKLDSDVNRKTESDMKIIIKQLRQSKFEDLTLTNTPKGTGGGYGVACDLDLDLESSVNDPKQDTKSDSAQLSPSLFNDWQELTGNIDPHDFESALHEYMMSPISSQELNNVILSLMSPKLNKNA